LGCLHGTVIIEQTPEWRIGKALQAAEDFSAGVRKPFHIVSTEGD